MAAMKVTTSAAMRARDVSRPHAEHLADAEATEAGTASSRPTGPAVPLDAPGPANAAGAGAAPGTQPLREAGGHGRADEAAEADAGRAEGRRESGRAEGRRESGRAEGRRESGRAEGGRESGRESGRADGGRGRPGGTRRRWRQRGSGRGRATR